MARQLQAIRHPLFTDISRARANMRAMKQTCTARPPAVGPEDMNPRLDDASGGDIVLFSGKGFTSGAVRFFTGSRWSHVGLVIRDDAHDEPLMLESTTTDEAADIDLGHAVRGVQIVSLQEKLAAYDGRVALRRLELEARPDGLDLELRELAELWRYRGYKDFTANLLADVLSPRRRPQHVNRVFCSELVAEVYKRIGVMCRSARSARLVPGDFARERVPFLTHARLAPPATLKG